MATLETLIAFNTFVVLGVGLVVIKYVVATERRLTIIETKIALRE